MVWPPISIKDTGSCLHSKLKEAIIQSGLEKNVFGNHLVSLPAVESRVPPPAFASDPLMCTSGVEDRDKRIADSFTKEGKHLDEVYTSAVGTGSTKLSEPEIVEIDGPSSLGNQFKADQEPNFVKSASPKGVSNI
ncbi:putative zinc finger protein-like 1 [Cocos nucifera]|uniref:Putative zinc finger protein-like 1 n=1 Tax=Cocos nucifera TaxID=13894 RepID=A0A8K0NBN1_COCNU|nr:putative zinc finger protein-like 1 [Cocos nucifera]